MIRRPVIAPGLHVLTDPAGGVLLGLDPQYRHRVPDTPGVRRALSFLSRGEMLPQGPDVQRARTLLEPVLRDADTLGRPGIGAADVAALALRHPRSASARVAARSTAQVAVHGDLGIDLAPLLGAVGLAAAAADAVPDVALVLSCGEPGRELLDGLARSATPHLVLRTVESRVVLGPFVVPGRTACLRCDDLHRNDVEPGYTTLLADTVRARRSDGVPEPACTALCWVALGLAVRDLLRYVEGDHPATWSRTLEVRDASDHATGRRIPPHPDCSCTWAERP